MRIIIDIDECIGCGQCEQIAPEVFELREDSMAYVLDETPAKNLAGKIDEAIEECPTAAIRRQA